MHMLMVEKGVVTGVAVAGQVHKPSNLGLSNAIFGSKRACDYITSHMTSN